MALWLSEADVRALLSLPELIGAMESALAAFSARQVDQPVRTAIEIRDRTFFASMPAYDGAHGILGAKLVTVFPDNAARGLHTHLAAISLFDAGTGELAAVMDGRYITELRTAAASAVSVRHLRAPMLPSSRFWARACRPAAIWRRCHWFGSSAKSAPGAPRGAFARVRPRPRSSGAFSRRRGARRRCDPDRDQFRESSHRKRMGERGRRTSLRSAHAAPRSARSTPRW